MATIFHLLGCGHVFVCCGDIIEIPSANRKRFYTTLVAAVVINAGA